jgi:hypothetical protein
MMFLCNQICQAFRGCEKIDNATEFKNNFEFRSFAFFSQPLSILYYFYSPTALPLPNQSPKGLSRREMDKEGTASILAGLACTRAEVIHTLNVFLCLV